MNECKCKHCVFCGKCRGDYACDDYFPVTEEGTEEYEDQIREELYSEYRDAWEIYTNGN